MVKAKSSKPKVSALKIPKPPPIPKLEFATFGAGCFWGVEELFRVVPGVKATAVGYMGGKLSNPTYEQVCTNTTGHAEVVQVQYNPKEVAYEKLLQIFFENHDPTTPNRQGPDFGTQYRSVIFYHSPAQKKTAEKSVKALEKSKKFFRPIVTQIVAAMPFWRAEEYHQRYLQKAGKESCHI